MSLMSRLINLQPISPERERVILGNFVKVTSYAPNGCVDGRKSEDQTGPYVQSLGGSLHPAVLNWILVRPQDKFNSVVNDTFNTLTEKGYQIGLHTGHLADNQKKSDCGFADNLGEIIKILKKEEREIFRILVNAVPSFKNNADSWKAIVNNLSKVDVNSLPSGHSLVKNNVEVFGANVQHLEGSHGELAAIVNTQPNTTLDVDNNQETPAFNLDLWHVLKQANELGLDETKAKLLSLGLYVATEKVLVEKQRGIRLPIIVRQ